MWNDGFDVRVIYQKGPPAAPCSTPMFPTGLRENERVVVYPPIPDDITAGAPDDQEAGRRRIQFFWDRAKEDHRFWVLADAATHSLAARWLNRPPPSPLAYGFGHGLDRIEAPMVWQLYRRRKAVPDFSDNPAWPLVSDRLLKILLEVEPDAVAHRPVQLLAPDGSLFTDRLHVIDVLNIADAVDYANSLVTYLGPQRLEAELYPRRVECIEQAVILRSFNSPPHIFRQRDASGRNPGHGTLIVSQHLKDRIRREIQRPLNIEFRDFFGMRSTVI